MPTRRDPTLRFSDRVDDYDRHRPRYPPAVIDVLREAIGLDETWAVCDVGSGTGISTELFLEHGSVVYAVEPNDEMRAVAERRLGAHARFRSVAAKAEDTGLPDTCVDLAVAAQAFHWFDAVAARRELSRILRAPRWGVLLWNSRHESATPFLQGYESLLRRHGTDYFRVRHDWKVAGALEAFFPDGFERTILPNEQLLDWEGLRGRLESSSYVPPSGDSRYPPMVEDLRALFDAHEQGGRVLMTYDCEVLMGRLPP